MKKKYICIACPVGCHLEFELHSDGSTTVTGNQCKRGIKYANDEYFSPSRMVTATCKVEGQAASRVPVKTTAAIPKADVEPLLQELYALEIQLPINMGDIIIRNFNDTGIDIVATRSLQTP